MPSAPSVSGADTAQSPQSARAQDIALALMGAGALDAGLLAENAVWERPSGAVSGRVAITRALRATPAPTRIDVDQVVTHGKSGSVSGRYWRADNDERLFCLVLRFTSATCTTLAQIVSFEHRVTP